MPLPAALLCLAQQPDGGTIVSLEYKVAADALPALLAGVFAEATPQKVEILDPKAFPTGLSNIEVLEETIRRLPPDEYRIRFLIARAEINGWKAPESDSHARTVVREKLLDVLGDRVEKVGSDQKTRWKVHPEVADVPEPVLSAEQMTTLESVLRALHREFRGADDFTVDSVMDHVEDAGVPATRRQVMARLESRPGVKLWTEPATGDRCVVWGRP